MVDGANFNFSNSFPIPIQRRLIRKTSCFLPVLIHSLVAVPMQSRSSIAVLMRSHSSPDLRSRRNSQKKMSALYKSSPGFEPTTFLPSKYEACIYPQDHDALAVIIIFYVRLLDYSILLKANSL